MIKIILYTLVTYYQSIDHINIFQISDILNCLFKLVGRYYIQHIMNHCHCSKIQ